ncbi:hypothetical protein VTH82DRAFT_8639 [Thermothelomyces myriococcoides]
MQTIQPITPQECHPSVHVTNTQPTAQSPAHAPVPEKAAEGYTQYHKSLNAKQADPDIVEELVLALMCEEAGEVNVEHVVVP